MHNNFDWLQLFAEGAEGGADGGAEGAAAPEAAPQKATFDQILEDPDYRSAYETKLQGHLGTRLKAAKAESERYKALDPVLQLMGSRYGIKPGDDGRYDTKAIADAMMGDNRFFEDYAEQHGYVDTESARAAFQRDAELAGYRAEKAQREQAAAAQQEQAAREAWYQKLNAESDALRATFPDFDLSRELQNPGFKQMIASGFGVEDAYYHAHRQEIMANSMSYAASRAIQGAADTVAAGRMRPHENGAGSPVAVATNGGPMTKAQLEDIRRRVARGEEVRL